MTSKNVKVSLVGVKAVPGEPILKHELLLFDQIASPFLNRFNTATLPPQIRSELEWLMEKELLVNVDLSRKEAEILPQDTETHFTNPLLWIALAGAAAVVYTSGESERLDPKLLLGSAFGDLMTHGVVGAAIVNEALCQVRTIPLLPSMDFFGQSTGGLTMNASVILSRLKSLPRKVRCRTLAHTLSEYIEELPDLPPAFADLPPVLLAERMLKEFIETAAPPAQISPLVEIVLDAFPMPDESVPWERIIDFREDDKTRFYLVSLRRWMRKIAKESHSAVEIREELEYLLISYKEHLEFNRVKTRSGRWGALAAATVDAVTNLAALNFPKAIQSYLKVREHSFTFLEAEQKAPGREVAYLIKAHEAFSRQ